MQKDKDVIIIDAGNTALKAARFVQGDLLELERFDMSELDDLKSWCNEMPVAFASVRSDDDNRDFLDFFPDSMRIVSHEVKNLPTKYSTLETLGIDRLANAAFLSRACSTDFGVAIDVGTCIKFDIFSQSEGYLGGSISPGITLKYNALNDYTGQLPRLSNKSAPDIVGNSTETSIRSGVINGIESELNGMIRKYEEAFSDLTFFVTGGDARYFDIHSKNDIFADKNLTLKGLYEIYLQYA